MLPIETTKKTVRICSVDEEIRIESFDSAEMDDFGSYPEMQEVQLVTAKILTAEELAESIARREESIKTPTRVRDNNDKPPLFFYFFYSSWLIKFSYFQEAYSLLLTRVTTVQKSIIELLFCLKLLLKFKLFCINFLFK